MYFGVAIFTSRETEKGEMLRYEPVAHNLSAAGQKALITDLVATYRDSPVKVTTYSHALQHFEDPEVCVGCKAAFEETLAILREDARAGRLVHPTETPPQGEVDSATVGQDPIRIP